MKDSRVYILTAVHNDLSDTKRLLDCIASQDYKNIETYVVDDGSTDGTSKYISGKYPKVKLVKGNGNLWWTGSLHLGIEKIIKVARDKDFVLTINNDCVFDKDYVTNLTKVGFQNRNSIVGSLVINSANSGIWDSGVYIDWRKGRFYERPKIAEQDIRHGRKVRGEFDALPTKGTLYPAGIFSKVGNFDAKRLPHYLSDYEFSARAKRNGYRLLVTYKARILNYVKRTGVGDSIPGRISFPFFTTLLFSRRSKVNVIDHWNFISLACPDEFKLVNYFLVISKAIHYLSHVPPFVIVPWMVRNVKKIFGAAFHTFRTKKRIRG